MVSDPTLVFSIAKPGSGLRLITVVYGLLLFVWLSPEDSVVWLVAVLGMGLSALMLTWLVQRRLGGSTIPAAYVPTAGGLLGTICGLGGTLGAAGLMFFKNALHAHVFWDYPPALVAAMFTRAPVWALAGGLVGVGLSLLWLWQAQFRKSNRAG